MKRIDLLYVDAASSHRAAAIGLKQAIETAFGQEPVEVRILDLVDLLAHQPFLQRIVKTAIRLFNWQIRHNIAATSRLQMRFFRWLQRRIPQKMLRQAADFWRAEKPDLVISVTPICNLTTSQILEFAAPQTPYWVIPLDQGEGMPKYWFDPKAKATYIVPSQRMEDQAHEAGIPHKQIKRISGIPIHPHFYQPLVQDRASEIRALGLNPDFATVLVHFGSQGSVMIKDAAERLAALGPDLNVIFLCGRDESLRQSISNLNLPYHTYITGFQDAPPARLYQLADVIVGKAGSMTFTEALITRTPIVAIKSKALKPVQADNEDWIESKRIGRVVSMNDLSTAVVQVLGEEQYENQISRQFHRGVFQVAAKVHRAYSQPDNLTPTPTPTPEPSIA
ncbi:glycosyltransferase [Pontibacter sp. G13]|uniref:glycosyltransferase n=1 Tax=Pontibacter sp. G13 TaxID=3074898 RepID=UPI00288AA765|nr:glycosyltransferase [Pontibacter sp. G13]WNJ17393.1 glycosyltransferase [Pontibacter sp. G13]